DRHTRKATTSHAWIWRVLPKLAMLIHFDLFWNTCYSDDALGKSHHYDLKYHGGMLK
ncbi:hypothetical protein KI387_020833, partial [Taxus chinensis]